MKSRAPWRRKVLELYGHVCIARDQGPCAGPLEAHHVKYRSQGGQDDTENGVPLCRSHHGQVHARTLLLRREWMHFDALDYWAEMNWVDWDNEGLPFGRGHRGFAALSSRNHDDY